MSNTAPIWLKCLFAAIVAMPVSAGAELPSARQAELVHLLHQDCGSCHGLKLTGGLGPPLTPSALKQKPDVYLYSIISDGNPGTPMPPWKTQLTPEEIQWLIDLLRDPSAS